MSSFCWSVFHVPLCGGCFIRHGCLSRRRMAPVPWTVPRFWGTHGYGSEFQWDLKSPHGFGRGKCSSCIGSTLLPHVPARTASAMEIMKWQTALASEVCADRSQPDASRCDSSGQQPHAWHECRCAARGAAARADAQMFDASRCRPDLERPSSSTKSLAGQRAQRGSV